MRMRTNLVPDLGLRGNKRLGAMLRSYLQDFGYLSPRDIARRWIADQEFWAPRHWLRDLLSRGDRLEVVTRALALLICDEEEARSRRGRGLRGGRRAKVDHLRRATVPILVGRAWR